LGTRLKKVQTVDKSSLDYNGEEPENGTPSRSMAPQETMFNQLFAAINLRRKAIGGGEGEKKKKKRETVEKDSNDSFD